MAKENNQGKIVLIIGGSRSGKSSFAEQLAKESRARVAFLASGKAVDKEMRGRIKMHQKKRPPNWKTIELNGNLPDACRKILDKNGRNTFIIIDCMTIYLTELLVSSKLTERDIFSQIKSAIKQLKGAMTVIVSNEVGMGLVPLYPLGRQYRDILGRVNQLIAAQADEVIMMVAGLPVKIKG